MRATREHGLLLRAALLPGEEGIAAWRAWRRDADLDAIDRGSARLLPLLWFNLLANGISDPWLPRFKGIYRHTWFGNQVWMRRVREVQALLSSGGVEPLFLKGIALANGYYENPGLRPMDDLDVLIPSECVEVALSALAFGGWTATLDQPRSVLRTVHAVELRSRDGDNLDVHAHLLQGSLNDRLDRERRARARRIDLADGPLTALEPTDQLLHILVHGVESDPPAPRWLADALVVMRREADIDWRRLVADGAAESRSMAVAQALDELVEVFGRDSVPVPDAVLDAYRRHRPSLSARFEHRIATGPRVPVVGYALQRAVDYRRWRHSANGDPVRRVGFDEYLRLNWGVTGTTELLAQAGQRAMRTALADVRIAASPRTVDRARSPEASRSRSPWRS